jgi:MFS family permease
MPQTSKQAWLTVLLLWVVAMLNYLDRMMITTMRDPIKAAIPMTDAQFGLLTAVFLWIYGALSPLGGFLADRFSRRWVILGSLLVWSAVTWITGYVESFDALLASRAVMGISEACYIPAALALITDYHRGSTRSLATGIHMSGIYTGAALGGLGGFIAEHSGWRSAFEAFGAAGVSYAVIVGVFLTESRGGRTDDHSQAAPQISAAEAGRALFGVRAFWILLLLNIFFGITNWGIGAWLPTYLREHFKLGLGVAGLSATGYIQFASFVGVLFGGLAADYWSRSNPRARALVPALGFCAAAPFLYLSATTNTLPIALVGLSVYGLSRGFFDANHMPVMRQLVDERYSATGYGFLNFVSCAAGGLMIYISGRLKDAQIDLSNVFQFAALGLLLTGLLLFAVRPRSQSRLS